MWLRPILKVSFECIKSSTPLSIIGSVWRWCSEGMKSPIFPSATRASISPMRGTIFSVRCPEKSPFSRPPNVEVSERVRGTSGTFPRAPRDGRIEMSRRMSRLRRGLSNASDSYGPSSDRSGRLPLLPSLRGSLSGGGHTFHARSSLGSFQTRGSSYGGGRFPKTGLRLG